MSRRLLLGIDDGTSAVKATLFDLDLRAVATTTRRITTTHPAPGLVEQDPLAVLGAVVDVVAELVAGDHGDVVACGLDHQGESVLAWDAETGAPLTPIHVWQDKRAQTVLDRLRSAGLAGDIEERSGLPLDPYFSAGKLAWLLENDASVDAARAKGTLRMGTVDAFLSDRLGAGFATDPSTASRTQLQAGDGIGWDASLTAAFGVPTDVLPTVHETAGALGELRAPSWPAPISLTARVCDQQAALAGAGCVVPGRVKATYGTGVFVLAHVGTEPPAAGGGLLPTVAWTIAGRTEYALDGGVFTAGALLEWLSGTLGLAPDPPALSALAATVFDSGGVRVLPALAGLGAPWWEADARGVIAGLTAGSTPAHIARAAIEAITWRVADIVALVGQRAPVGVLRIDGGLTAAALLPQMQADVLGVPVQRSEPDATVLGAAMLAGVGAGLFPSLAQAAERLPAGELVHPQTADALRAASHQRWRKFVSAAAELG